MIVDIKGNRSPPKQHTVAKILYKQGASVTETQYGMSLLAILALLMIPGNLTNNHP